MFAADEKHSNWPIVLQAKCLAHVNIDWRHLVDLRDYRRIATKDRLAFGWQPVVEELSF